MFIWFPVKYTLFRKKWPFLLYNDKERWPPFSIRHSTLSFMITEGRSRGISKDILNICLNSFDINQPSFNFHIVKNFETNIWNLNN
jgi:hypothetical protein